jgi:hypothetical protein
MRCTTWYREGSIMQMSQCGQSSEQHAAIAQATGVLNDDEVSKYVETLEYVSPFFAPHNQSVMESVELLGLITPPVPEGGRSLPSLRIAYLDTTHEALASNRLMVSHDHQGHLHDQSLLGQLAAAEDMVTVIKPQMPLLQLYGQYLDRLRSAHDVGQSDWHIDPGSDRQLNVMHGLLMNRVQRTIFVTPVRLNPLWLMFEY